MKEVLLASIMTGKSYLINYDLLYYIIMLFLAFLSFTMKCCLEPHLLAAKLPVNYCQIYEHKSIGRDVVGS